MLNNHPVWLDGTWDFQIALDNYSDATPLGEWRSAIVPMPWQAQFEDLRNASGTAWYRRHFSTDPALLGSSTHNAAILHFGAVNYHAHIWLNGESVGEHEGGYTPFEFDIFNLLHPGENELLVKVIDPTDDRRDYADFPFSEIPHGKQSWYGPIGGIWQSVWLEFRPKLHIANIKLNPSPTDATIVVTAALSETKRDGAQITCAVTNPSGQVVATGALNPDTPTEIHLEHAPELWSPDSPALYTVNATLLVNGNSTHSAQKTCGFRTVEAHDGCIYLNGKPIYLRGVLDQGYYPETIYTPNSLELLEAQARSAKALGFNCLRIHIKAEDPRYYEVADRLGLLVWTEIPNWEVLTDAAASRARLTFNAMLERDGHHPSIIIWTLINENWGTDLARNAEHRRWLSDFYQYAKLLDPTRLIVDNSACGGNAHVTGDLEDFHNYRAIPDHADEWDDWVAGFAGRSEQVWFPDFAHERHADLPLLVSEFGNWGLPDPDEIQEHGKEPWWFETGFEWDGGIVYPHGVKQRYEACGLADLFPSYAEFARQSQEHMARSLHYEISSMRLRDSIAGYIVTEFTDVHWECNGLLTMQRKPKHRLDPLLKDLNQDMVVVLRPEKWSGQPGAIVQVNVQAKDVSGQKNIGSLHWQSAGQSGMINASDGTILVRLGSPGVQTLFVNWLGEGNIQLAKNQIDLVCVVSQATSAHLRVVENTALATRLRNLKFQVSDGQLAGIAEGEIVVANRYTRAIEAHLQSGGRVVLLADPGNSGNTDSGEPSVPLPVGQIVERANTIWQGDWANSFSWVKKTGPLAHLPGNPLLEMEWSALMPDAVLAGLPSWVQRSHSWAGLALGWVHKAVSLLTVLPYGRGKILITTFKLNDDTLTNDAVAQALFSGMLNLL